MRLYLSSFRLGNRPEEMIKLLSEKKRTAVIANATDYKTKEDRDQSVKRELNDLMSLSLEPEELDLRLYLGKQKVAEQALSQYDLLWVRGGNSFILRRALKQSGADEIIKMMLMEDRIVYGGYSAGPGILTSSLHGAELVDDPYAVPEGYDPQIVWEGLGILPYAFVPHFESPEHPETEAIGRYVQYLTTLAKPYKALHDGQALVINGMEEMIVG